MEFRLTMSKKKQRISGLINLFSLAKHSENLADSQASADSAKQMQMKIAELLKLDNISDGNAVEPEPNAEQFKSELDDLWPEGSDQLRSRS